MYVEIKIRDKKRKWREEEDCGHSFGVIDEWPPWGHFCFGNLEWPRFIDFVSSYIIKL